MTDDFAPLTNKTIWKRNLRYGRVICCIGVNPNKIYDVTPLTRAQLLREMLTSNDANDGTGRNMGASCKNVQVEGKRKKSIGNQTIFCVSV